MSSSVTGAWHVGQTRLASRLAPPRRTLSGCFLPYVGGCFGIVILAGLAQVVGIQIASQIHAGTTGTFIAMLAGTIAMFVGFVWMVSLYLRARAAARAYNRGGGHEADMDRWHKSMHCHRCGRDFVRR